MDENLPRSSVEGAHEIARAATVAELEDLFPFLVAEAGHTVTEREREVMATFGKDWFVETLAEEPPVELERHPIQLDQIFEQWVTPLIAELTRLSIIRDYRELSTLSPLLTVINTLVSFDMDVTYSLATPIEFPSVWIKAADNRYLAIHVRAPMGDRQKPHAH